MIRLTTPLLELLAPLSLGGDQFSVPAGAEGRVRLYGGQVVAQALAAATATVAGDRPAHSLHAYFIRAGRVDTPTFFRVMRDRDGRSVSARRVEASQDGEPILTLSVSFHEGEAGPEHSEVGFPDVPDPESLPSYVDLLPPDMSSRMTLGPMTEMDIRPIDGCGPDMTLGGPPRGLMWFRIPAGISEDAAVQRVLLSYASDMGLLAAAMRPHPELSLRSRVASLDHAVWFHDEARVDDWLLYAHDSPWAARARGLVRGSILSRDGRLIASVAQEGLLRVG